MNAIEGNKNQNHSNFCLRIGLLNLVEFVSIKILSRKRYDTEITLCECVCFAFGLCKIVGVLDRPSFKN